MSLIADGAERRIIFSLPRAGFAEFGVRSGTLWFEGQQAGRTYRGYAYRFFKACGAIRYPVTGEVSEDNRTISLRGQPPTIRDSLCHHGEPQEVTFELLRVETNSGLAAPARNPY